MSVNMHIRGWNVQRHSILMERRNIYESDLLWQ